MFIKEILRPFAVTLAAGRQDTQLPADCNVSWRATRDAVLVIHVNVYHSKESLATRSFPKCLRVFARVFMFYLTRHSFCQWSTSDYVLMYCFYRTAMKMSFGIIRCYTLWGIKKHTKMCFAITFVKLDGFWTNLADCFLNKFFIKQCKQMSPELSTSFVISAETWKSLIQL